MFNIIQLVLACVSLVAMLIASYYIYKADKALKDLINKQYQCKAEMDGLQCYLHRDHTGNHEAISGNKDGFNHMVVWYTFTHKAKYKIE